MPQMNDDDMICSMGQNVSLNVRIKSKGFTWKSLLNNATDVEFGATGLMSVHPKEGIGVKAKGTRGKR